MPQTFPLIRRGQLLLCNAEATGPAGAWRVSLLVDTGSNYTVVGMEGLEAIGCSPAASADHVRITTADGVLIAPRVRVNTLTLFDQRIPDAEVIAHDLPFSGPIDGLLGMDILVKLRAQIDIVAAQIEVG